MRIKIVVFFTLLCTSHVTNVVCEYIVMKTKNGHLVPLDETDNDDYGSIYEILIKYQWPTNLLFAHDFNEATKSELWKKSVNTFNETKYINSQLKKLNCHATYIPNTIYQLFVINHFINNFSTSDPMYNCYDFLSNFFKRFCSALDEGGHFYIHFKSRDDFEEQCREALTHDVVIGAHAEVNCVFGEYLKQFLPQFNEKKAECYYSIAAGLMIEIVNAYNNQNIMDQFNEEWHAALLENVLSDDIRTALFNEIQGKTLKEDSIIKKCIDAEMNAQANNTGILFRGAEPFYQITSFSKNDKELFAQAGAKNTASTEIVDSILEYKTAGGLFVQYNNASLQSCILFYGIAPFIGALLSYGDMPYEHAIKPDNYFYVLDIDKYEYYNNNCGDLFIIPPLSAFVQVFGCSSMYFAVSKVAVESEIEVSNEKVNIENFGLIYDETGLLLTNIDPMTLAERFSLFLIKNMHLLKQPTKRGTTIVEEESRMKNNLKNASLFYGDVWSRHLFDDKIYNSTFFLQPQGVILDTLNDSCTRDEYYIYKLSQKLFNKYFDLGLSKK